MNFFTNEDLDFFQKWHLKPYEKGSDVHYNAKEQLMDTVWEKTVYLCQLIVAEMPGFGMDGKKIWSQRGWKEVDGKNIGSAIFKPYTWVKIFRDTDRGRDIYFTFEINAVEEAFVCKIDCRSTRDSKLSAQQIELCRSLTPRDARWHEIPYEDLLKLGWESLKTKCIDFINNYLKYYDAIIDAIWGSPISPAIFNNTLIKQEKPRDGYDEIPEKKRNFNGVDVDFIKKAIEQKDLGDRGENLVKQYEIDNLKDLKMYEEAAKVEIVRDGMGYDVLSFDKDGNRKFIEVKTTTGNEYAAFYLSDNELEFMKTKIGSYSIYRIYNYDEENNFGEFYEIENDVQSQILLKPTNYCVQLKGC